MRALPATKWLFLMPSPRRGEAGTVSTAIAIRLIADLGASVIKIEPPQGDMLRQFPSSLAGESRFFLGTNRGKRAIALDLKQPEGLAVLHRLVKTADVLVENFRPSVPARLGIDYPRLKAINPRLVYCELTGYGDSAPVRTTFKATSSRAGSRVRVPPLRQRVGVSEHCGHRREVVTETSRLTRARW